MSKISWSIVRPIVTLAFVAAYIWGFVAGRITTEDFKLLAVVAVTWWYTSRDAAKAATQSVLPTIVPDNPPKSPPPAS